MTGVQTCALPIFKEAWAERALKCGYPERFAQKALGHNSRAVHHAYSKHAEVPVPSLDDWEKQWKKNPQGMEIPKVVAVISKTSKVVPTAKRWRATSSSAVRLARPRLCRHPVLVRCVIVKW